MLSISTLFRPGGLRNSSSLIKKWITLKLFMLWPPICAIQRSWLTTVKPWFSHCQTMVDHCWKPVFNHGATMHRWPWLANLSPFSPPPPLPPQLQEEKKGPVLRINSLSFWNHSWTQLNSNRSIQICSLTFFPVKGEYLAVTNLDLPKAFSELFCQSLI